VRLVQNTRYPWDGTVTIVVEPEVTDPFTVQLRIPGWCDEATVRLNGELIDVTGQTNDNTEFEAGFLSIRRPWKSGDTITLDFPMPVRQVASAPQVEANVGRLAIMRGPMVYCLEDIDNPCRVDQVAIAKDAKFETEFRPDLLGGVTVLKVDGRQRGIVETDDGFEVTSQEVALTAVPYYAWDNREPGRMVVWVPTDLPGNASAEGATVAVVAKTSSSHCYARDTEAALNDNILPKNSIDHDVPRLTWWDHLGTTEWVAYEFAKPKTLSKSEVYWFDDTGRGACRVPAAWRLLFKEGDEWRPVETDSSYGVAKDKFNSVTFQPVTTTAIRLEVELQDGVSGGILEWRLPR
jgi:hypothetical protein